MNPETSMFVPIVHLTLGVQATGGLVANLCINPAAAGHISADMIANHLQRIVDQIRESQFVSMAGLAEETPHA